MNVGQQQVPTRFCNTRTQVSDVDGIRAVRTNVGEQWVPKKLCKRTQVNDVDGRRAAHTDVASSKGCRHTA